MFNHRLGISAALAAVGIIMSAGASLAVEAMAEAAVNVRTGPGTSYGIVDQLTAGEVVDITECSPNNWCFVEHSGPDGWVSANFLTAADGDEDEIEEGSGDNPDCSFGFVVGPGGPTLSIQCGNGPLPEPAAPPVAEADEACFYTGSEYQGTERCFGLGTREALAAAIDDRISSVRLLGDARARLCVNQNLGGFCRNVNDDTPALGPQMNNRASSLVVFVGVPPAPVLDLDIEPEPAAVPSTHSTGPIELQQTFTANLDNGNVGGAGVDIWYQAVTAAEKYITPSNGAQLALGDGSNRGYDGCSTEAFSGDQLALEDIPPGTYVCAKTNQGRISQFRVNGFVGTTMKLGYTTWSN